MLAGPIPRYRQQAERALRRALKALEDGHFVDLSPFDIFPKPGFQIGDLVTYKRLEVESVVRHECDRDGVEHDIYGYEIKTLESEGVIYDFHAHGFVQHEQTGVWQDHLDVEGSEDEAKNCLCANIVSVRSSTQTLIPRYRSIRLEHMTLIARLGEPKYNIDALLTHEESSVREFAKSLIEGTHEALVRR